MRRRADDYINATHILKAANLDKPGRTRILERDVQKDPRHEKVQGGYGKYQGRRPPSTQSTTSDHSKAHGYHSKLAQLLLFDMVSMKSSESSSNLSLETSVHHLLRNTQPTSQRCLKPNLRFRNGEVSLPSSSLERQC